MNYPVSNHRNSWSGHMRNMFWMGVLLIYWVGCTHPKIPGPVVAVEDYRDKWTGVYTGTSHFSSFLPKNGTYVWENETVRVLVKVEKYTPPPNMLITFTFIDTPQYNHYPIGILPIGEDGNLIGIYPENNARFFSGDSLLCGTYLKHGINFYSGNTILAKKLK